MTVRSKKITSLIVRLRETAERSCSGNRHFMVFESETLAKRDDLREAANLLEELTS